MSFMTAESIEIGNELERRRRRRMGHYYYYFLYYELMWRYPRNPIKNLYYPSVSLRPPPPCCYNELTISMNNTNPVQFPTTYSEISVDDDDERKKKKTAVVHNDDDDDAQPVVLCMSSFNPPCRELSCVCGNTPPPKKERWKRQLA